MFFQAKHLNKEPKKTHHAKYLTIITAILLEILQIRRKSSINIGNSYQNKNRSSVTRNSPADLQPGEPFRVQPPTRYKHPARWFRTASPPCPEMK
jgi:hypothetical protein